MAFPSFADTPKAFLSDTWILESNNLEEDILIFSRNPNALASNGWGNAFIFDDLGNVHVKQLIPEGRGICGNGLLYLNTSTYRINKKQTKITLHLVGGHAVMDTFEYKKKYKVVALTDRHLILQKKRTKIDRKTSMYHAEE